jgi:mannosyltransferase
MSVMIPPVQTAPAGADRPAGVLHRFGWVLPVLVTAVVVRYQAARPQLWRDELATWWASTRSPTGLDRLTSHIDAVFVPYYRFMHVWTELFGDSTLSLRTPSMIAVVATAGVVAVLGKVLGSPVAGVLGGLLFAALPSTSRYGQEARPYALAALAATTATLLLLLALRHRKWWYWAGYTVALSLAGALHMIALLILAGHLVAVVRTALAGRTWRPLRWAGGAVVLAVAPVVPIVLRGHRQVGLQLGNRVLPPDAFAMGRLPEGVIGGATIGGAVVALAVAGALLNGRTGAWFGLMTLAPVAAFLVAAQVAPIYTLRYVFFLAAPAALLAGLALSKFRVPAAVVVILVLAFLGLRDQDTARRSHESPGSIPIDYRHAASIVAAHRQPGDSIVYHRSGWQFADLGLEYYLRGDTPADALAAESRDAAGSYWTPEVTDPATALAGLNRVWWVDPINLGSHQYDQPPASILEDHYREIGAWRTSGFQVRLYERP